MEQARSLQAQNYVFADLGRDLHFSKVVRINDHKCLVLGGCWDKSQEKDFSNQVLEVTENNVRPLSPMSVPRALVGTCISKQAIRPYLIVAGGNH